MLKAVFFDFDGVIVNSEWLHFKTEKEIFGKLGLEIIEKEYNDFIGVSELDTYSYFINKHNLKVNSADILKMKISKFCELFEKLSEFPVSQGIIEFIKDLKSNNIRLFIGSSGTKTIIEFVLEKIGMKDFFEKIICSADVPKTKPNPDIYLKLIEISGFKQNECLVIEDSKSGITAAKNAGIKVFVYNNPQAFSQNISEANFIFNNFEELSYQMVKEIFNQL